MRCAAVAEQHRALLRRQLRRKRRGVVPHRRSKVAPRKRCVAALAFVRARAARRGHRGQTVARARVFGVDAESDIESGCCSVVTAEREQRTAAKHVRQRVARPARHCCVSVCQRSSRAAHLHDGGEESAFRERGAALPRARLQLALRAVEQRTHVVAARRRHSLRRVTAVSARRSAWPEAAPHSAAERAMRQPLPHHDVCRIRARPGATRTRVSCSNARGRSPARSAFAPSSFSDKPSTPMALIAP